MATELEKMGFKVGDRFLVHDSPACDSGSVLEILEDDGTDCPPMRVVSGHSDYTRPCIVVARYQKLVSHTRIPQARLHSLLEACLGTAIGFLIALGAQLLIFPQFGIAASMETNLAIAGIMTVVSIIRSYFIRRFFNMLHIKGIL